MHTAGYLLGCVAVLLVVVSCGYAQQGVMWAKATSRIGIGILFVCSSVALLLAAVLMLVGCPENCAENGAWWTQGQGQQFVAAFLGWSVIATAGLYVRQREFLYAAVFLVIAVAVFGLWALLVEAGWSDRGPLALVPAI